jgi:hypothetical protein
MSRRPAAKRGDRGRDPENSEELLETAEDILEEVQQIREDIRPVIWLAWIYLFVLAIAVIVSIVMGAALAASQGG